MPDFSDCFEYSGLPFTFIDPETKILDLAHERKTKMS